MFYEAPHRVVETLRDIEEVMGPRPVVVARELTKLHEEFLRGTAEEIAQKIQPRGEMTILIGKGELVADDTPIEEAVRLLEQEGVSRMDAIKQIAKERGLAKREVYRLLNP